MSRLLPKLHSKIMDRIIIMTSFVLICGWRVRNSETTHDTEALEIIDCHATSLHQRGEIIR